MSARGGETEEAALMPSIFDMRRIGAVALAGALLWTGAARIGTAAAADAAEPAAASAQAAATAAAEPYRIVVLGDSISVGYEPGATKASDLYGYADRLLDQALLHGRAEETNFAIMGLTTEGLNRYLQGAKDRKPLTAAQLQDFSGFDPRIAAEAEQAAARTVQLGDALAQANLVALTIGGNDFLDYIRQLSTLSSQDALAALDRDMDAKLNNYAAQAEQAVRLIHDLAPRAQIRMTDQYLPIPEQYDAELYKRLLQETDDLADRLDKMADKLRDEQIDVAIVPIRQLFVGKELSYTHIFDAKDVHPNQAGYAAIAEAFADALWGKYTIIPYASKGSGAQPAPPAIYIDGSPLATANKPVLKNGTTFLALSDIAAATHAQLTWDNKTRTAAFRKNGNTVSIAIGAKTMTVNGAAKPVAAPAYLQQVGTQLKTYVPLAAVAEGLQYQVVFRSKLYTAFIHS